MVDRTTVLPPLVHAVLDACDRLPWGPPTAVSDGLTQQTAVAPFCADGVVVRFTATLPDVHASVLALLYTREINHVDIIGEQHVGARGEVARSTALFECDLTPFSSDQKSNDDIAQWLSLNSAQGRKLEEALFVGGGENPEAEDCPAGFPDCHPSCCPIVPRESLTYFASETPNHRTRDFVIRKAPVVDLSIPSDPAKHHSASPHPITVASIALGGADATVESPRSPRSPRRHSTGMVEADGISDLNLAREAASIPPTHTQAYVHGTCSCSGAVPAVKRSLRSGLFCRLIISSETSDTVGCSVDICYAFHVALAPDAAISYMHNHLLQYITQARFLTNDVFGGAAVDIQDPAVVERTVAALRKKKHRELRAAAAEATGCCCCCAVQ